MTRPLIAVLAHEMSVDETPKMSFANIAVGAPYVAALQRAGARPALLAPPDDGTAEELLAPFAGLLLTGGPDVDPARYGATPHPSVYGLDHPRDDVELRLAAYALASGLPLLAICRGVQVLNVAAGGTLVQHIAATTVDHGAPHDGGFTTHDVRVDRGSALGGVLDRYLGPDGGLAGVPTAHHQAVGTVGKGLRAVAWTEDGCIEAVEPVAARGFCVAVQWHPEMAAADEPAHQAVFDAFVAATRDDRSGSGGARRP